MCEKDLYAMQCGLFSQWTDQFLAWHGRNEESSSFEMYKYVECLVRYCVEGPPKIVKLLCYVPSLVYLEFCIRFGKVSIKVWSI